MLIKKMSFKVYRATLAPDGLCHPAVWKCNKSIFWLKSTLKVFFSSFFSPPPVLQAGWTDAMPPSSQLPGCGRPCQRAPAAAGHGPVRRGHHHQYTHTHPHCDRHQHLPRYRSWTHTHTHRYKDVLTHSSLSVRVRGGAAVFLLSAQLHWVGVGQTDLCLPPGY